MAGKTRSEKLLGHLLFAFENSSLDHQVNSWELGLEGYTEHEVGITCKSILMSGMIKATDVSDTASKNQFIVFGLTERGRAIVDHLKKSKK